MSRKSFGNSNQKTIHDGGWTWDGPWRWVEDDWVGLRKDEGRVVKRGELNRLKTIKNPVCWIIEDYWDGNGDYWDGLDGEMLHVESERILN